MKGATDGMKAVVSFWSWMNWVTRYLSTSPLAVALERLARAVIVARILLDDPSDKCFDDLVRSQLNPRVVPLLQLFLCERRVNLSVASLMDEMLLFAAV